MDFHVADLGIEERNTPFYVSFYTKSPETERTSRGAKKLIIQSCHLPPEFWIMVSSPLNIAYSIEKLKDKCQFSIFIGHQTKEPEKIHPVYGLATQMDYNVQAIDY